MVIEHSNNIFYESLLPDIKPVLSTPPSQTPNHQAITTPPVDVGKTEGNCCSTMGSTSHHAVCSSSLFSRGVESLTSLPVLSMLLCKPYHEQLPTVIRLSASLNVVSAVFFGALSLSFLSSLSPSLHFLLCVRIGGCNLLQIHS